MGEREKRYVFTPMHVRAAFMGVYPEAPEQWYKDFEHALLEKCEVLILNEEKPSVPLGELDLDEANQILKEYTLKDSTVDIGNLYFAACAFRDAYEDLWQRNREKPSTSPVVDGWPVKQHGFLLIEDHCEDGEWSGYASSTGGGNITWDTEALPIMVFERGTDTTRLTLTGETLSGESKLDERKRTIREARNHFARWPDELTSDVMFFKGERITRDEFEEKPKRPDGDT